MPPTAIKSVFKSSHEVTTDAFVDAYKYIDKTSVDEISDDASMMAETNKLVTAADDTRLLAAEVIAETKGRDEVLVKDKD